MLKTLSISFTLAALIVMPSQAQYLTLGGDDMDACASYGEVVGLSKKGDNFLAVRDGPGTSYSKIDELHNGDEIFLCTESGGWQGIVYGDGQRCGVGSPIVPARVYNGPCKSGWVSRAFVTITAG